MTLDQDEWIKMREDIIHKELVKSNKKIKLLIFLQNVFCFLGLMVVNMIYVHCSKYTPFLAMMHSMGVTAFGGVLIFRPRNHTIKSYHE